MSVLSRLENLETFRFEDLDEDSWKLQEGILTQIIEGTPTEVTLPCSFTETGDIAVTWPNLIQTTFSEEKLYWDS